eukprot:scaffold1786_cov398-Prasinococcus_capsulatus_cf.AAC.37
MAPSGERGCARPLRLRQRRSASRPMPEPGTPQALDVLPPARRPAARTLPAAGLDAVAAATAAAAARAAGWLIR